MKSNNKFSMKYDKQLSLQTSVLYQARYCAQEDISVVVFKDGIIKTLESPFCLTNFTSSKPVCSSLETSRDSKLVVSGSRLYVLGESQKKASFVKFSESSKSWNVLPSLPDERSRFCVCSFTQKIIVVGGNKNHVSVNSCMAYSSKCNEWTYISSMKENRENSSCTVFQGKIVVTGGWKSKCHSRGILKTVESYCFHENKWVQFPDMLQERCGHGTVSMGNKMFVISRFFCNNCEVFENISNTFTSINSIPKLKKIYFYLPEVDAITVGYKIYAFQAVQKNILLDKNIRRISTHCYDVKEKAWTFREICDPERFDYFSCAKMFKH